MNAGYPPTHPEPEPWLGYSGWGDVAAGSGEILGAGSYHPLLEKFNKNPLANLVRE